jgi:hypothetical protein
LCQEIKDTENFLEDLRKQINPPIKKLHENLKRFDMRDGTLFETFPILNMKKYVKTLNHV